jgi:hypothetical protein
LIAARSTASVGVLCAMLALPVSADQGGEGLDGAAHPRCYLCHGADIGGELVTMAREKAARASSLRQSAAQLAEQIARWHHDRPGFGLSSGEVALILAVFGARTD